MVQTENSVYNMDLHATISVGWVSILRVPWWWLYFFGDERWSNMVFVPFPSDSR